MTAKTAREERMKAVENQTGMRAMRHRNPVVSSIAVSIERSMGTMPANGDFSKCGTIHSRLPLRSATLSIPDWTKRTAKKRYANERRNLPTQGSYMVIQHRRRRPKQGCRVEPKSDGRPRQNFDSRTREPTSQGRDCGLRRTADSVS